LLLGSFGFYLLWDARFFGFCLLQSFLRISLDYNFTHLAIVHSFFGLVFLYA
jgi:hypothetical protein